MVDRLERNVRKQYRRMCPILKKIQRNQEKLERLLDEQTKHVRKFSEDADNLIGAQYLSKNVRKNTEAAESAIQGIKWDIKGLANLCEGRLKKK